MKRLLHVFLLLVSIIFLLNTVQAGPASEVLIQNQQIEYCYNVRGQKVKGFIDLSEGRFDLDENYLVTGGQLVFDFTSITVENARSRSEKLYFEKMLKGQQFFDVRANPYVTLNFKAMDPTFSISGNANVEAELIVKDISRHFSFNANFLHRNRTTYGAGRFMVDLTQWEIFGGGVPETEFNESNATYNGQITSTFDEEEPVINTYGSSGTTEEESEGEAIEENSRFAIVFKISSDSNYPADLFNDDEDINLTDLIKDGD